MRILGIDPGTSRVGFGLIETEGGLRLLDYGTLEANEKDFQGKMLSITRQFRTLLKKSRPELASIERLYFAKNQKTAIAVAQARGALLSILLEHSIQITEFSPNEVKSQITGYGLADKKGVAKMVMAMLKTELSGYDDASDALAIAITAANHQRFQKAIDSV